MFAEVSDEKLALGWIVAVGVQLDHWGAEDEHVVYGGQFLFVEVAVGFFAVVVVDWGVAGAEAVLDARVVGEGGLGQFEGFVEGGAGQFE